VTPSAKKYHSVPYRITCPLGAPRHVNRPSHHRTTLPLTDHATIPPSTISSPEQEPAPSSDPAVRTRRTLRSSMPPAQDQAQLWEALSESVTTLSPAQAPLLEALQIARTPQEFADAGKPLLLALADQAQECDLRASVLWGYLEGKIWGGRWNATNVPSRAEYLLELGEDVKESIDRGTSTAQAQQSAIRTIEKHWGRDWLEEWKRWIPDCFLEQETGPSPTMLSKRLLQKLAQLAKEKERGLEPKRAADGCRDILTRRVGDRQTPARTALQPRDIEVFFTAWKKGLANEPATTKRRRQRTIPDSDDEEEGEGGDGGGPAKHQGAGAARGEEGGGEEDEEDEGEGGGEEGGGKGGVAEDEEHEEEGGGEEPLGKGAGTKGRRRGHIEGPAEKRRRNMKFFSQSLYQDTLILPSHAKGWAERIHGDEGECIGPAFARELHGILTHLCDNVVAILGQGHELGRPLCTDCRKVWRPLRQLVLNRLLDAFEKPEEEHAGEKEGEELAWEDPLLPERQPLDRERSVGSAPSSTGPATEVGGSGE